MTKAAHRLRLFIAAAIPEEVLQALDSAIAPLRETGGGARWTPPEAQHVTLKFLGSVEPSVRDGVAGACEAVAGEIAAAQLVLGGFGAFPSARKARVLWAGIEDDSRLLARLAAKLDDELQALGITPESRDFTPHLTLARFKVPSDARDALEHVVFRSEPVTISTFHLFQSHLSPKGARYEVLDSFVLKEEVSDRNRRKGY